MRRTSTSLVRTMIVAIGIAASQAMADPLPTLATPASPLDPISAYLAGLPEIKRDALATQPSWVSPIVTTTARLEQNLRYEQVEQVTGQGQQTTNFDNGKGARFIVAPRLELQANPPPIDFRPGAGKARGTGDWQFTSVRYRVASADAEHGDYVLTVYSNFQAPTGLSTFTQHAWIYSPSIAAGKGFGAFDIQANVTLQVPGSRRRTIGDALVGNVALQYHLWEYFWPQLEVNTTHFIGGQRGGLTQIFLTPGILFGRFNLTPTNNLTFGIGYQVAVSPTTAVLRPVLTPSYDHALILASRLSF